MQTPSIPGRAPGGSGQAARNQPRRNQPVRSQVTGSAEAQYRTSSTGTAAQVQERVDLIDVVASMKFTADQWESFANEYHARGLFQRQVEARSEDYIMRQEADKVESLGLIISGHLAARGPSTVDLSQGQAGTGHTRRPAAQPYPFDLQRKGTNVSC